MNTFFTERVINDMEKADREHYIENRCDKEKNILNKPHLIQNPSIRRVPIHYEKYQSTRNFLIFQWPLII